MTFASIIRQYLGKLSFILLQFGVFFFFVYFFVISPGEVNGNSMENTFVDEEKFFVQKWIYFLQPPQRFDVIQFLDPSFPKRRLMKRIIGLPGETILIKSNRVFIREKDGTEKMLEEQYLSPTTITKVLPGQAAEMVIPVHHFFVLGDHRVMSTDSRAFGPLERENILGKITRL